MIAKYSFLIVVFINLAGYHCVAQNNLTPVSILQRIMENIRSNKNEIVNADALYQPSNAISTLKVLQPYFQDSLYTVRLKAYSLTATIGNKTSNASLRKQTIHSLLQGCLDKESSVSGICSKALQQFRPADFDASARQQLATMLTIHAFYLNNLVQLAGYLNEVSYQAKLRALLNEPALSKKNKWAVQLALARTGDEQILSQILTRIKRTPVNDDLVYEAASALVYIRQKQSMDYLFEILMSEEKNCESANPDSDQLIPCAYQVLEYITPVLKNFPLQLDASGDLDVADYLTTLTTARTWYINNSSTYELIKDTF